MPNLNNSKTFNSMMPNLVPQFAPSVETPQDKAARDAAEQMIRNEQVQQKMAQLRAFSNQLGEQSPTAASRTNASNYVASPEFYSEDPQVARANAEKTFTGMREMPGAALFGRKGAQGEVIPDQAYALSQEIAQLRGFDPRGSEAAALYGGVVDQFMKQRYSDALQARNAYNAPVDSYQRYVDLSQIGYPKVQPTSTGRATNMSYWSGENREAPGSQSTMYVPEALTRPLPVPAAYTEDPMRVRMQQYQIEQSKRNKR
jgi:hypothetical protein